MYNIETLYSSYQELLLDLDIFGRLVGSQGLDDKEAFKDLLFQEYAKARPIPTLESRDCELSEPVSVDFHVSYRNELELAQGEEVISWDDEDDEVDEEQEGIYDEEVIPDNFPSELFRKPLSVEDRDTLVEQSEYFKASSELEDFSGDVETVVGNFGSIEQSDELVYVEEDESSYAEDEEFSYDDDEDFDYDDDDAYEDDDIYEEDVGVSSEEQVSEEEDTDDYVGFDDDDIEFMDSSSGSQETVVEVPRKVDAVTPPIVLPNLVEPVQESKAKEEIPSDLLQYLRLHPRCEISEVLQHYPRKDLERYIRIGKVIKKGSKVYI